MSKFRSLILIFGLLIIAVATALLTVLILYATGTIVTDPIELVYSVGSDEKIYDGTPLTLAGDDYCLVSGDLLEGHTAEVKVIGSQTNYGTSESSLEVKIYDGKGFDVTKQYAIKVDAGTLTVEKRAVSVVIPDSEVVYSGKEVYFNEYEIDGELVKGHKIAGANATLLNAGDTLPEDIEPVVYDAFDNDVSENYEFLNFDVGAVRIIQRDITIKPVDITKVYDGTEIEATEYEIVDGSLAAGQKIRYTITTTSGGEASFLNCTDQYGERIQFDLFNFEIIAEDGTVVTDNYNYVLNSGLVTIEQRPLTIATSSQTFTYNGAEQYNDSFLFYSGTLAPNQIISVKTYTTVTEVEKDGVDNVLTFDITADGQSVYSNYKITNINGKLTVNPLELTVYTKSYSKIYDGKPLGELIDEDETNYELKVELNEKFVLLTDYGKEIADRTDVIEETAYKLSVSVNLKKDGEETDCTDNFAITVKDGKYSVTKRQITVNSPSSEFVYNGNQQYNNNVKDAVEGLPDNFEFEVLSYTRVTDVSDAENNWTYIITLNGNVVSDNFDIDFIAGTLTVTPQTITIHLNNIVNEYIYDGNEKEIQKTIAINRNDLVAGLQDSNFKIQASDKLIDAGTYDYTAEFIDDSNSFTNYSVEVIPAIVVINRKEVALEYNQQEQLSMTYAGSDYLYNNEQEILKRLNITNEVGYKVTSAKYSVNFNIAKAEQYITFESVEVSNIYNTDITQNLDVDCSGVTITVTVTARELKLYYSEYTSVGSPDAEILKTRVQVSGNTPLARDNVDSDILIINKMGHNGYSTYWIEEYDIVNSKGESVKHLYTAISKETTGTGTIILDF